MVQFTLSKQEKMLRNEVGKMVRELVAERAHEMDESGEIPGELLQKFWELGISVTEVPEKYGGFGMESSCVENALAIEELAYGDASLAIAAVLPSLFITPVLKMGSREQQEKYLPYYCSSKYPKCSFALNEPYFDFDPCELKTTAELKDGKYVLNGKKCLAVYAGSAEHILVAASLQNENHFFIVDTQTPGLEIHRREQNMGFWGLDTYEINLENCVIPKEDHLQPHEGYNYDKLLQQARTASAALATGIARASYDLAKNYAKTRTQFGEPIAHRQSIAFMLAEMAYEVDALRFMAWSAASKLDNGRDAKREAYLAKTYANEMSMKLTDYGVQILGGHGYIRDYPAERYYRNARGISNFEALAIV
ncbi:MAG: acyl-CoA dehydrogenase family protein [Thermodesulfobacteriota bacterium]